MALRENPVHEHIERIREAMHQLGVWSDRTPSWVKTYDQKITPDLWQWLQYIYLPMRLKGIDPEPSYLAPQITPYLYQNPAFNSILQLIIELDAMTPTIHTSKNQRA